jgi:hypothetical protein
VIASKHKKIRGRKTKKWVSKKGGLYKFSNLGSVLGYSRFHLAYTSSSPLALYMLQVIYHKQTKTIVSSFYAIRSFKVIHAPKSPLVLAMVPSCLISNPLFL